MAPDFFVIVALQRRVRGKFARLMAHQSSFFKNSLFHGRFAGADEFPKWECPDIHKNYVFLTGFSFVL
jgi:hypothetical protein